MDQNLNFYYIFYTVAKCKNISAASKELFISQPAISKSILKLEEDLQTTLFHRSSRGVTLTEAGEVLFSQLETAFHAIRQGEEQLIRMQNLGMGHLSIGASATLCKYVLLPVLSGFVNQNPHVEISVHCQSTAETMEALEKGTIDIGLIGFTEQNDAFSYFQTMEVQDIFVSTATYLENLGKRTKKDHTDTAALLSESTLIVLNKENVTRQFTDKYLSSQNLVPAHIMEVTSMDLLIEFARIDLGIACVIQDFVSAELESGKLVEIKTPVPMPKRAVGFAYLKNAPKSESLQKFLSFCQTSAEQRS